MEARRQFLLITLFLASQDAVTSRPTFSEHGAATHAIKNVMERLNRSTVGISFALHWLKAFFVRGRLWKIGNETEQVSHQAKNSRWLVVFPAK